MKIIVDPKLPNAQLFVDIIHQVADRYIDRMIHKSILIGKLATLEIVLKCKALTEKDHAVLETWRATISAFGKDIPENIYKSPLAEDVHFILNTFATNNTIFEDNHVFVQATIEVSPFECLRNFAYEVAWMMTHMLVSNSHNYDSGGLLQQDGPSPCAGSMYQYDPKLMEGYGNLMEECASAAIAEWLVKDMSIPCNPDALNWYEPDREMIRFVHLFADAFGKPLKELRYLDEFTIGANDAEYPNIFWYVVAVNQFGYVISRFDTVMGDSAYQDFCWLFEYGGLDKESQANSKKEAEEMLLEFARRSRAGLTAADFPSLPQ